MKEKFSDYDSKGFLSKEGQYEFEITSCELKDGKNGVMVVFEVASDDEKATIYHSLNAKARWSYNNLIAACLKLSKEDRRALEIDYELIGHDLVGKKFIGIVTKEMYEKEIKVPLEDGTFDTAIEEKESFKITSYLPIA